MANMYTLNEINNGTPLVSGNKLGDSPFNRYPSSRTELKNQCLKHDLNITLSSGIQLGTRNSLLIKNNESFSECVCQLENVVRECKNEINQKEISLAKAENEITAKLEEIQALQSEIKELEIKNFLAQKDLSEMDSLRQELAQTRQNVELKNVDLDLKEDELSEKKGELIWLRDELTSTRIGLMDKKEELMQMRDNLSSVQKTLSEKETLLQD
jgi:chromosome segregation ATPase